MKVLTLKGKIGLLTLVGGLGALLSAPAPAFAYDYYPQPVTGVGVSAVTHSSFTAHATPGLHDSSYRLWVSPNKGDLYENVLEAKKYSSAAKSVAGKTTTITVGHIPYSPTPLYYRFEAYNAGRHSYSKEVEQSALAPLPVSKLRESTSSSGQQSLTWTPGAGGGTGFQILQGANSSVTANVKLYASRSTDGTFTPPSPTPGVQYYYKVRGMNNGAHSGYSSVATASFSQARQPVRVLAYNLLSHYEDGIKEGGNTVAPWWKRGPVAAALVKRASPGILGVEEAAATVGDGHSRQADSLAYYLGKIGEKYSVAHTETTYAEAHAGQGTLFRTGDYILYKPSLYRPVGDGGNIAIGNGHYAVSQELENISSGAKLIVVDTHLSSGSTATLQSDRYAETQKLLAYGAGLAKAAQLPIVYLGDYNSNQNDPRSRAVRTPMAASHVLDSALVSPVLTNAKWDSENVYRTHPDAYGTHIDYLWTNPGVGVTGWGEEVNIKGDTEVGTIASDHNPVYANLTYGFNPA